MPPLIVGEQPLMAALLIISDVSKFLLMSLCLETAWRGSTLLLAILASCAIGIALHRLLPGLSTQANWCGSVVGNRRSSLLKSPPLGLGRGTTLLQGHGAAALLMGLLIGKLRWPWLQLPNHLLMTLLP